MGTQGAQDGDPAVESCAREDADTSLLVAGKGPVSRYNSPVVQFLGPVKEMKSIYWAADLFITPTIYEPFSLAALEALSAGLPVITSSAAGISEVMTPGVHGEIIDNPADVTAFAGHSSMVAETSDTALAAQIPVTCSSLAAEFTLERNLGETISLIQEVIDEKIGNNS